MSELKYDGDPSEPVLIQSNQTKLSCFPYILYEILEKRNTSRTVRSGTIKTRSYNT
jgi:hypothetical protein